MSANVTQLSAGTFTARFALSRETKGTYVFVEVEGGMPVSYSNAKIGTLYVRKSQFHNSNIPNEITVTVTPSR